MSKIIFPAKFIHRDFRNPMDNFIVVKFDSPSKGVVIENPTDLYENYVGTHSTTWTPCDDINVWTPYGNPVFRLKDLR